MCKILRYLLCCCFSSKQMVKKPYPKKNSTSEFTTKTTDTKWETLKGRAYAELPTNVKDLTKEITIPETIAIDATEQELTDYYKLVLNYQEYECLGGVLGKGGYGIVFKVRYIKDQTKEILAAKAMRLEEGKFDKKFEVFKRELFLLRSINHKNIIGLREHFVCNHIVSFMILEFANKGSLKMGPMDEKKAKVYFIQMVSGLTCLHKNDFYHGDIKLDNMLLTIDKDGKEVVKVSDFGTTRVYYNKESGDIPIAKARGTVAYMAPEVLHTYIQTKYKKLNLHTKKIKNFNPQRADMWSLGYCFYELLCGNRPFSCDKRKPQELYEMWKRMKKAKRGVPIDEPIRKRLNNECIQVLNGLICFPPKLRYDHKSLADLPYVIESDYYLP